MKASSMSVGKSPRSFAEVGPGKMPALVAAAAAAGLFLIPILETMAHWRIKARGELQSAMAKAKLGQTAADSGG